MSSPKNTRLSIVTFIFVALFIPVFIVISAKSQFGLDEMMGPELDAGFITTWPETVDGMLKLAQVNQNDLVMILDVEMVALSLQQRRTTVQEVSVLI